MDKFEIRRLNLRAVIRSHCDGKAVTLANKIGREASYVSRMLAPDGKKGKKRIGEDMRDFIESALMLPKGWLDTEATAIAEMHGTTTAAQNTPSDGATEGASTPVRPRGADHETLQEEKKFDENVSPARLGGRPIPVISAVQAGALKDMETPYAPGAGFAIEYVDDENLSRWAFSLELEGESMMPDFRPGDRVIIDPDLAPNPGDFVVAKNGGEQATFKKYRPRGMDLNGNMVFELVPLNNDYATLRSDIDHLIVIGVMVEHRKRYRRSRS